MIKKPKTVCILRIPNRFSFFDIKSQIIIFYCVFYEKYNYYALVGRILVYRNSYQIDRPRYNEKHPNIKCPHNFYSY